MIYVKLSKEKQISRVVDRDDHIFNLGKNNSTQISKIK